MVDETQHVEAEGLVHVGHLREGNILGGVADRVEVPRGHGHDFRTYPTGSPVEAEGAVAQGVLVNALVHDRLDKIMEVFQQFPHANAVEVACHWDEPCFSEGALGWVAREDLAREAGLTKQFQFINDGVDHLFL